MENKMNKFLRRSSWAVNSERELIIHSILAHIKRNRNWLAELCCDIWTIYHLQGSGRNDATFE